MRRRFAAALALAAAACTSSSSGSGGDGGAGGTGPGGTSLLSLDANALCNQLVNVCGENGQSLSDCVQTFTIVRVTQACIDGLKTATCADLARATSPVQQACFPSCTTPSTNHCNGDGTITECSQDGDSVTADCAAFCTTQGRKYTGTCAASFMGQTDTTDKCWCQ